MFVDTGNYSRSPAAEIIATAIAKEKGVSKRYVFSSAGIIDKHVGGGPDQRTVMVCEKRGYDFSGFRCRQADASIFQTQDKILAMDKMNFAAFSLARREGDHAEVEMLDPGREIPDPFYSGEDSFELVVTMIEERLKAMLDGNA